MTSRPLPRILIVEDEVPMRTVLSDCLASEGYRILVARDGEEGLQVALDEKPDLILLDVMMPKLDGFGVCTQLRRAGQSMPILLLTAKGQLTDKIRGLDCGADDYLVKPFSVDELLARVRALLRRLHPKASAAVELVLGDNVFDFQRQVATRKGKPLRLTAKEFSIMRLLAERRGEPISREHFLDQVWEYTAFPTTRTVDNHIASLRGKIGDNAERPHWIITVHGVGYRLEVGGT